VVAAVVVAVVVAAVVAAAGAVVGVVQVQAMMMALPVQAALLEVEGPPLELLPYLYPQGQLFKVPLSQLPMSGPSALDEGPLDGRSKYLLIVSRLNSTKGQYTITMACNSLSHRKESLNSASHLLLHVAVGTMRPLVPQTVYR
jgi:hypothetical protein